MKAETIIKIGILSFMFIIIFLLYKVNFNEQETKQVFSSRYTLFDFTFTAKYFDTSKRCWTFESEEVVKEFYLMDGHFETPLSKRLIGKFAKGHNHFPGLFSKCK